jgi:hypothetical protein
MHTAILALKRRPVVLEEQAVRGKKGLVCAAFLSLGLLVLGCCHSIFAVEQMEFAVKPATTGQQLVRASLPLPRGFLGSNHCVMVSAKGCKARPVGLRVLSWHPAKAGETTSARRALLTFPHRFADLEPVRFALSKSRRREAPVAELPVRLLIEGEFFTLTWADGRCVALRFIAPPGISRDPPRLELVEANRFYRWQRLHLPDPDWPRVLEFRLDAVGSVVVAHLQRATSNGYFAPEMGWELTTVARALGREERWLDAIEKVLRGRVLCWLRSGKILSGLEGWEISTGTVKERRDIYRLYEKPADRDFSRDYTEGNILLGSVPPEGLVYFPEVLAYYLQHRPAARLLAEPNADEPLGQLLNRIPCTKP